MSLIQIRNVPEEVHRILKERAAREGKTLSDYQGETAEESVRAERDAR